MALVFLVATTVMVALSGVLYLSTKITGCVTAKKICKRKEGFICRVVVSFIRQNRFTFLYSFSQSVTHSKNIYKLVLIIAHAHGSMIIMMIVYVTNLSFTLKSAAEEAYLFFFSSSSNYESNSNAN